MRHGWVYHCSGGLNVPFAAPGQNILTRGGRRVVVGSPVAGPVADVLLDFQNNIYRVDGVSYASANAAGFAGTGTFDASGYTATGAQALGGTVALPGDFIVLADFAPAGAVSSTLYEFDGASQDFISSYGTGLYRVSPGSGAPQPSFSSRIAYGRSGGNLRACFDNGSVAGSGGLVAPVSGTLVIGNNLASTQAWASAIRKIAIYRQTLSDAQIQALA